MKIGIWGAGNIANIHAQSALASGVEIAAVVDKDINKAKEFADKWGIANYSDNSEILFEDEVEAVHLCTPPALHYSMIKVLIQNKKHILCEKPLCIKNDEANELVQMAEDSGLICAVNLNVRYHEACIKYKNMVNSDDFGKLLLVHGRYLQEFHVLPAPLDWRYNTGLAGSMRAVTEIGSHWFDLAQYISGLNIDRVLAQFAKTNPERKIEKGIMHSYNEEQDVFLVDSEDAAAINIHFENGAIGTVFISEISQGRTNNLSLELTGENKNIWWNSENNNALHSASKGSGVNTQLFPFGNGFNDTFKSLAEEFYASVKSGKYLKKSMMPTFYDGAKIVKICNAVFESAKDDSKWKKVEF